MGGGQSHSRSLGQTPAPYRMEEIAPAQSSQSHRKLKLRKSAWGDLSAPSRGIRTLSRKFSHIADQYHNLDQVQNALREAGLESSNLILGIDFTKSNEWTGRRSFNGRSLHAIGDHPNPYEQAISIIGRTLAVFDEDNLIPCFGFGDASTHDQHAFSFYQDHHPCQGFGEALDRYRQIVPKLQLSGPTSFAPVIQAAMKTVEESGGQYHVLVIIADGQVTTSVDTIRGNLSPQEKATIDAIVAASDHPLSIILVGVGDGPWEMMRQFDDNITSRAFDNFQFVNFSEIMARPSPIAQKEALFALAALMEIPQQYKATIELDLLGRTTGNLSRRGPLPPPRGVQPDLHASESGHINTIGHSSSVAHSTNQASRPQYTPVDNYFAGGSHESRGPQYHQPPTTYPPSTQSPSIPRRYYDQSQHATTNRSVGSSQACPLCMSNRKDMAFGCGHQTCRDCGKDLQTCPICREKISTRIRLYPG